MLNRAGAVKVMDFGIARAVADGQATMTARPPPSSAPRSTCRPEQARGEAVDARSDVYATGCVLYELLTGAPPFTGDSPVAIAYQHVREAPVRRARPKPGLPKEMDAIVLKALNKNPLNRYQTAAEMRSDLVRALSGQAVQATPLMSDDERTAMLQPALDGADPADQWRGCHRYARRPRRGPLRRLRRRRPGTSPGPRIAIGIAAAVVVGLLALTGYLIFGGLPTTRRSRGRTWPGSSRRRPGRRCRRRTCWPALQPVDGRLDERAGPSVPSRRPAARSRTSTVTLQVGTGPDAMARPLSPGLLRRSGVSRALEDSARPRGDSGRAGDRRPNEVRQDHLPNRRAGGTFPPGPPSRSSSASSRSRRRTARPRPADIIPPPDNGNRPRRPSQFRRKR